MLLASFLKLSQAMSNIILSSRFTNQSEFVGEINVMKKSTHNILTKIPIYGVLLKRSSKGEMRLCSPFLQDLAEEGIRPIEIYELLEEKYTGEVVTRERFYEGYYKILN